MPKDRDARDKSGGGNQHTPTLTLTRSNCLRVTFLQETLTLTFSNVFELEKHFSSDANGMAMLEGCVQHFRMQLTLPWSMHLGNEARMGLSIPRTHRGKFEERQVNSISQPPQEGQ